MTHILIRTLTLLCLAVSLIAGPRPLPKAVYPYSVLPGGLIGVNLERVKFADSVLSRAWSGVGQLSPASLRAGFYYIQYRKGDQTGWTKEPRKIAAGEPVMVDQAGSILRVRCGNGISGRARLPLVPFVPPPAGLPEIPLMVQLPPSEIRPDLPLAGLPPVQLLPLLPQLPFAPSGDQPAFPITRPDQPTAVLPPDVSVPLVPVYIPPGQVAAGQPGPPAIFVPPPPVGLGAPEPGTWALLLIGFITFFTTERLLKG
jgi:hypothetical protein